MNNQWKYLGCFQDADPRTMAVIEGTHALITGDYTVRTAPVLKCFYVSKWRNFRVNKLECMTLAQLLSIGDHFSTPFLGDAPTLDWPPKTGPSISGSPKGH